MKSVCQTYFDNAELALAAYGDFAEVPRDVSGILNPARVKDSLVKPKAIKRSDPF